MNNDRAALDEIFALRGSGVGEARTQAIEDALAALPESDQFLVRQVLLLMCQESRFVGEARARQELIKVGLWLKNHPAFKRDRRRPEKVRYLVFKRK